VPTLLVEAEALQLGQLLAVAALAGLEEDTILDSEL
jgi:hypothetical protein